ncbi:MAG: FAD:protein FMN transferase [Spirochaetales bacterium]|nr:FAD:protein FMN transferase [Spirochaetales bacterium]
MNFFHRPFVKSIAFANFLLVSLLSSCADPGPIVQQQDIYTTSIILSLYGNPPPVVFDKIFARLHQIDLQMSAQRSNSEINDISDHAGKSPVKVSPDTLIVLENALSMAKLTHGIFDPTIGPVTALWNVEGENPHVPSPEAIAHARALVNWRDVVINQQAGTVFLTRPGMRLDFGGIAKGYAMDEAVRIARNYGVKTGIFNMGDSSICLLGTKSNGEPWKVGIQDPSYGAPRSSIIGIVQGYNFVVETSGPYERYFVQNGKHYHHIMDPRTGAPAESGLSQVTLLMPVDTTLGDGLSTSCFILGLNKGMQLINSLSGASAIFVTKDKKVYLSPGVAGRFSLTEQGKALGYRLATLPSQDQSEKS